MFQQLLPASLLPGDCSGVMYGLPGLGYKAREKLKACIAFEPSELRHVHSD